MLSPLLTCLTLWPLPATPGEPRPLPAPVESRFAQVHPVPPLPAAFERRAEHRRAVILLHGLSMHPISKARVEQAYLRTWQQSGSRLVLQLGTHADVFAFAYGQNAPVERIAERTGLPERVRLLVQMGYRDVVLVGHSAGGLIARHLVEDHPDLGVTRVIQVCAPNTGSSWASVEVVRGNQAAFLASLTKSARKQQLAERADRRIPARVEFACVLGTCKLGGDGVVASRSQWPEDLRQQGIPVFPLRTTHREAMATSRSVELLGTLIRDPLPRWEKPKVAEMSRKLLAE
jgi:pimeloyl-ACP methyl ester carboxylesterase